MLSRASNDPLGLCAAIRSSSRRLGNEISSPLIGAGKISIY